MGLSVQEEFTIMSAVDTRNLDRDSLFLMAQITFDGRSESTRGKVRNLSAGGMMVEGEFEVERGTRVTAELRNIGKVKGNVAWVQGSRIGVAFDAEIDPKLARAPVGTKGSDVPSFARPVLDAPKFDDPNRSFRRI
jgi:hypothetical protein